MSEAETEVLTSEEVKTLIIAKLPPSRNYTSFYCDDSSCKNLSASRGDMMLVPNSEKVEQSHVSSSETDLIRRDKAREERKSAFLIKPTRNRKRKFARFSRKGKKLLEKFKSNVFINYQPAATTLTDVESQCDTDTKAQLKRISVFSQKLELMDLGSSFGKLMIRVDADAIQGRCHEINIQKHVSCPPNLYPFLMEHKTEAESSISLNKDESSTESDSYETISSQNAEDSKTEDRRPACLNRRSITLKALDVSSSDKHISVLTLNLSPDMTSTFDTSDFFISSDTNLSSDSAKSVEISDELTAYIDDLVRTKVAMALERLLPYISSYSPRLSRLLSMTEESPKEPQGPHISRPNNVHRPQMHIYKPMNGQVSNFDEMKPNLEHPMRPRPAAGPSPVCSPPVHPANKQVPCEFNRYGPYRPHPFAPPPSSLPMHRRPLPYQTSKMGKVPQYRENVARGLPVFRSMATYEFDHLDVYGCGASWRHRPRMKAPVTARW